MAFLTSCALLLALSAIVHPAASHNWMTKPKPYNHVYRTYDCVGRQCTDACPSKLIQKMPNSRKRPAETWKRGQKVSIKWTRNNHHGGFVRLSLVPVNQMWDRKWHSKLALQHGCWETGLHDCERGEDCGTDREGKAFGRTLTVPRAYKDGDYVFGFLWFGGLNHSREHGQFPDFYSCSHVRINGGAPVGGEYQARFVPGRSKYVRRGKCKTSADRAGPCEMYGCAKRKAFYSIPEAFRQQKPDVITPELVEKACDSPMEREENVMPSPWEEYAEEEKDKGICSGRVCCASSCGTCGGPGCQSREGGGEACCIGAIMKKKMFCNKEVGAPCVRP